MAKSSMKIVLVDPLGDILFSGDSLIGADVTGEDDAKTPATVSGIYPRARITVESDSETEEAATVPAPSRSRVA